MMRGIDGGEGGSRGEYRESAHSSQQRQHLRVLSLATGIECLRQSILEYRKSAPWKSTASPFLANAFTLKLAGIEARAAAVFRSPLHRHHSSFRFEEANITIRGSIRRRFLASATRGSRPRGAPSHRSCHPHGGSMTIPDNGSGTSKC